jgi:hypothetical protein
MPTKQGRAGIAFWAIATVASTSINSAGTGLAPIAIVCIAISVEFTRPTM